MFEVTNAREGDNNGMINIDNLYEQNLAKYASECNPYSCHSTRVYSIRAYKRGVFGSRYI